MQKIYVLLFLLLLLNKENAFSQKILLDEDRTKKDYLNPAFGPNEPHYLQLRAGLSAVLGEAEQDLSIGYGRSLEFTTGLRYKLKINGLLALGLEPGYKYTGINISQKTTNSFFDSTFWPGSTDLKHEREKFGYHSFALGGFLRFNFDPGRGNTIGAFLDLGAEGNYILSAQYLAVDKARDGMTKSTEYTNLNFVSPLQYNYYGRLGYNFFALIFRYRPSNLFKKEFNAPELPRYSAGIEITLN